MKFFIVAMLSVLTLAADLGSELEASDVKQPGCRSAIGGCKGVRTESYIISYCLIHIVLCTNRRMYG